MHRLIFSFFLEVVLEKLLCVIRDRLAESVGPVMLFTAVPAAVRAFSDVALDPQTLVSRHPEDFDLLQVATIVEGSGEVTPLVPPRVLLTGVAWAAAQKPRDDVPEDGSPQLSLHPDMLSRKEA